jgi:hypothetical protein
MAEYEDRHVKWWIIAPPAFPIIIGPLSTDRPEHVAADDPRADVGKSTRREVIVDARGSLFVSLHFLPVEVSEGVLGLT